MNRDFIFFCQTRSRIALNSLLLKEFLKSLCCWVAGILGSPGCWLVRISGFQEFLKSLCYGVACILGSPGCWLVRISGFQGFLTSESFWQTHLSKRPVMMWWCDICVWWCDICADASIQAACEDIKLQIGVYLQKFSYYIACVLLRACTQAGL